MASIWTQNIRIDQENPNDGINQLLAVIRPKWQKEKIVFKKIEQGLLNTLIRCHHQSVDNADGAVVVKIFADKSVQNREYEVAGLQVGMHVGIGPSLVAIFDNGIVMQYIAGDTLSYTDFSKSHLMKPLIQQLARLHHLNFKDIKPFNKSRESIQIGNENIFHKIMSGAWNGITEIKDPDLQKRCAEHLPSKDRLWDEFQFMMKLMEEIDMPICLGHGDFQHTNIIHDKKTDKLTLVDFEFYGYNYRARDFVTPLYAYDLLIGLGLISPDTPQLQSDALAHDWVTWYMETHYQLNQLSEDTFQDDVDKMVLELKILSVSFQLLCVLFMTCYLENEQMQKLRGIDTFKATLKQWQLYISRKDKLETMKLMYLSKFKSKK